MDEIYDAVRQFDYSTLTLLGNNQAPDLVHRFTQIVADQSSKISIHLRNLRPIFDNID
jgi:hypothetical protein